MRGGGIAMKVKRKKSKISKCTEAIYQMAVDISDNRVIIFLSYHASLITLRELPDLKACCEEPIHIYTVGPKVCGASEC